VRRIVAVAALAVAAGLPLSASAGGYDKTAWVPSQAQSNRPPDRIKPHRENPRAPAVTSSTVPAPPADLSPAEAAVWSRLALEVADLGVYATSFATSFRQLVRLVWLAEVSDPFETAPSAFARLQQTAASSLDAWGLRPASASVTGLGDRPSEGYRFKRRPWTMS
jgi:hypothetical protein